MVKRLANLFKQQASSDNNRRDSKAAGKKEAPKPDVMCVCMDGICLHKGAFVKFCDHGAFKKRGCFQMAVLRYNIM